MAKPKLPGPKYDSPKKKSKPLYRIEGVKRPQLVKPAKKCDEEKERKELLM